MFKAVGFKPDTPAFQARFAEAIQQGQEIPRSGNREDIGGGVKVIETLTNFSAGRLERTDKDTDMAIIGNGFFTVADENGQPLLTRAGDFRLDNTGKMVTAEGSRPVLDAGGAQIQLVSNQPWSVSADGFIEQNGTAIPIGLVQPDSLDELNKVGGNLFTARGNVNPVPPTERDIRQGYLELSGANSTSQMMAMIETSRAFESNTKMIQNQDGMTSQLISRLLRAS